jgi:transposase
MREIVKGIFYVIRAGRPWRLLPNDLPPWGAPPSTKITESGGFVPPVRRNVNP